MARKSKLSGAGVPPAVVHSGVGVSPAAVRYKPQPERIGSISPLDGIVMEDDVAASGHPPVAADYVRRESVIEDRRSQSAATIPLAPIFRDDAHGIFLYQGDCLEVLDAIYAKYGDEGRFDMIAVGLQTASRRLSRIRPTFSRTVALRVMRDGW